MALELTSKATKSRPGTRSAKTRRPVTTGVVIRFDAWKKQRPTRGRAAESETVIVDARGSWIDGLVGLFDNSVIGAQIIENERRARKLMDADFVMPE